MEGLSSNLPSEVLVDLCLTSIAVLMFAAMGFALRRYLGATQRNRPLHETLPMQFVKRTRPWKVKQFSLVAQRVLADVHSVILEKAACAQEARAFLPLLVDARRKGEGLMAGRLAYHSVLTPWIENQLPSLVRELAALEEVVKSLPKSHLTIEDVLAGKFD